MAGDVFAYLSRVMGNATASSALMTQNCGGSKVGSADAQILPSSMGQDFTWDDVGYQGPFDSACLAQSVIQGGRCAQRSTRFIDRWLH